MSNKKLTVEFIRSEFEKEDYQLLTTEYTDNKQKLDYICSNNHQHSIIFNNWQRGNRCPYCSGKAKPTIDFIKSEFEKEGYKLLTSEYRNNTQKLYYICPNSHQHSIRLHDWNSGYRCKYCAIEFSANKRKLSFDFIKSEFEKEGYKLLSTEYENNSQKLDYICPNNHKHNISWSAWQQGQRCPYCCGQAKPTIDFIRSEFEKEGYKLLTVEYKNSKQKLDYICPNRHQHSIIWNAWQRGHRCKKCATYNKIINFSGANSASWRGGISFEPYCSIWKDQEYKADIRERDGNQCLNPYCFHNNEKVLHIHHIDYDKKNCAPHNLITLCRSCNLRANTNRKWHTEWYKTILNKRYNYNYE